jgi:hypothetical protein
MIIEDVKGELPAQIEGLTLPRKFKWHRRQKTTHTPMTPSAEAFTTYKYNFNNLSATSPKRFYV